MQEVQSRSGVVIVGGGLAGIAAALELLDHGQNVTIVDRDTEKNFGGLAKLAFGGMLFVNTPIQRWNGIKDSAELALNDWHSTAGFGAEDEWPRRWAELYVHHCTEFVYRWLRNRGVQFFPVPHWVERGDYKPGNSVPRYHIIWGTGEHLIKVLVRDLMAHPNRNKLTLQFEQNVTGLLQSGETISGVKGVHEKTGEEFELHADAVIVASGGINGDLERVRKHWDHQHGPPPNTILNGAHYYADGRMHDEISSKGGNVTHLEWMWNYAAGIHHPKPRMPLEGLSVIPPKSALWMDCRGNRVGPLPLVTGFDTLNLCRRIAKLENGYTWQVMNWKIATKELAVSGAESNPNFRDRRFFALMKDTLLGNKNLIQWMIDECEDVVTASSLDELANRMNQVSGDSLVDVENLRRDIERYDAQIDRGAGLMNDDQLRRIANARGWRGDRARLCKFQKILDRKAMPLIAIREFIVSRKSNGGIQTDLDSRVLSPSGNPIPGLYAAGEAAGFGGGGINGAGSLEGTFMSNCILNGRIAARSIAGVTTPF